MAMTEGFEPSTPRAEIWCSIQLSYVTAEIETIIKSDRSPREFIIIQ